LIAPALLSAQHSLPKQWNGEILEADQGLVSLYSTMIDSSIKHRSGEFTFILKGRRSKISYSFSAATQDPAEAPSIYWKVKEDTYDLMEASFVDSKGRKRSWQGPYPKAITVKPRSISSMGNWYLVYLKADGRFNILLKPARPNIPLEKWQGSVRSLVDGLTGEDYELYKAPQSPKKSGFRQVVTGVRKIQMLYKLDLFKFNTYSREMSGIFQTNDADIRTCYTDLLDRDENAKGQLVYAFIYSGIAQGIKSLKIRRTTMTDAVFQECMHFKLRGLTFPIRQSVAGELIFQFNTVQ